MYENKLKIACNYDKIQYENEIAIPYLSGQSCSNCKNICSNNLCVCDKICENFGELDLNTCTCKCRQYATGSSCETLLCNKIDEEYGCYQDIDSTWCGYSNILPICPHMCGICDFN